MEILLLLLAVAAFFVGNKLGTDNGRRQTLENLNRRIAAGLDANSEFVKKYGVRGTHLTMDYMGENAKLGTGYNPDPYVDFVVIHSDDFKNQVEQLKIYRGAYANTDDEPSPSVESELIPAPVTAVALTLMQPNAALSEIVGNSPLQRSDALRKLKEYVQANNLQDSTTPRNVNCDARLRAIYGVDQITWFALVGQIDRHLS